jgi:troponin T
MGDDETSSNTSKKGDEAFASRKAGISKDDLNEHLREYINEWKKQRSKDEEELKRLKEKQMKRKEIRAEQDRKLNEEKKLEEDRLKKIEAEKKQLLEEEKKRQMEEAERKRQEASDGKGKKGAGAIDAHKEMSKTKEQLDDEMKISLSFRIKPLDLESMDSDDLKTKANDLFNTIVKIETEKYDAEQRQVAQEYDLKELKERYKVQLRQKAAKKGLDPEAFTGKYPPTIRMFSKYERRTDTRSYNDRKGLYEGGWEVVRTEALEVTYKEKLDDWNKRTRARLPKWFGERPGKKAGDPETPEGEEEEGVAAAEEEAYEEEEEEDYDEDEE